MTKLTAPVTRLTSTMLHDAGHTRPIVATLAPCYIELRLKGARNGAFQLPYAAAYHFAARLSVEAERAATRRKL